MLLYDHVPERITRRRGCVVRRVVGGRLVVSPFAICALLTTMAGVWTIHVLFALPSFVLRSPVACPAGLALFTRIWLNASSALRRPTIDCDETMWPHFGQAKLAFYDYGPNLDPAAKPRKMETSSSSTAACAAPLGWENLRRWFKTWTRCFELQMLPRETEWVVLDSAGYGRSNQLTLSMCAPRHVTVACLSCPRQAVRAEVDIGVPPPTFPHPSLFPSSAPEVHARCMAASTAVVFRGSSRTATTSARLALTQLNGTMLDDLGSIRVSFEKSKAGFEHDLREANFAFCPRGDAFFSYRLSEVLAAGVIPIITSDGWLLPLEELIPWPKLALILDEADISTLPSRLKGVSRASVCQRRVELFNLYHKYMASAERWLAAIELILKRRRAGVHAGAQAARKHGSRANTSA
jgi:hypothetical protein